jgi:hypothetical protein
MNRVSLVLACHLLAFLAFSATPTSAQSSGINPYYRFDINLSGNPTLNSTATKSLTIQVDSDLASRPVDDSFKIDTDGLPDKPEPKVENLDLRLGSSIPDFNTRSSPPMGYGAYRDSNTDFWILTASVYGSNVAAIELLQNCLGNNRCRTVPPSMRGRPAMYVTGMGVASGVSYLGYHLKKREVRWWFVPAILATTFDMVFVIGAAKRL